MNNWTNVKSKSLRIKKSIGKKTECDEKLREKKVEKKYKFSGHREHYFEKK